MKKISNVLAVALMAGMFIVLFANVYFFYKNTQNSVETSVQQFSINIAKNVAVKMDSGLYHEFLKNPTETKSYWKLRDALNDFREKTGALYVYTMKVDEQNKVAIMVDGQPENSDVASGIGVPTTSATFKDIEPVLNGKPSSTPIVHDPEYGDYLSAFVPIEANGEVIGILGVDMDAKNINQIESDVVKSELPIIIALNVLLIVIVLGMLTLYLRRKLNPLSLLSTASEEMATGNLQGAKEMVKAISIKGSDEISLLTRSYMQMTENTIAMIANIHQSSEALLSASDNMDKKMKDMNEANFIITSGIQEVAGATDTQLIRTEESVRAIEEMTIGIQRIAQSSNDVSQQSHEVTEQVKEGTNEVGHIITYIHEIKDSVDESAKMVQKLGNEADEIKNIVDIITAITEQTNLLALNAAIEAARAGEHGKGFAVVSQEVRKLAEESKRSAEKISLRLQQFTAAIEEAVINMNKGTSKVEAGAKSVSNTDENFNRILKAVESVSSQIQEVSAVTEQMSASSQEISASIEEFAVLSKETAGVSMKVAASTQSQEQSVKDLFQQTEALQMLSAELRNSISSFKI